MPFHILVLDDQPEFYKYLFSNNAGVEKRLCTTKQDFLDALQEGTIFDLILLDLSLEGEKASGIGLDFLLELKKTRLVLPPVLVVTNDDSLHTYRAAMNRGAIGFYTKGKYNAEDLANTVYLVLKRSQGRNIPDAPALPQFAEWFRSTRNKPTLIYGPDGTGKDFWMRHCLRTYFPMDCVNFVDLEPKDAEFNWQDPTAPLEELVSETIEPITALSSSQTHWVIKGVNYIDRAQVQQINKFLSRVPNPIFVSTTDLQELVYPAQVISSTWRTALLGNAFDLTASQPVLTEILGYWLSFTKVCPLNSPFYGAKVAEVFDPGVLEKLTQHFGSVYHRKLFEATQSMLYRAQERIKNGGYRMIIFDDLPNELKLHHTRKGYSVAPLYTEPFLSAEKYLVGIETRLSNEMTELERAELDKKRPEVEGYYRNYHSRLDKQVIERTIRYFALEEIDLTPFRIFVAFHSESEVFYDRFEKHLAQIKRDFCI